MATIPLPALAAQPSPGPLETYGRVLQMKSLMGQQQLQQSQLATQELERQQQQNALTMQQIQLNDINGWHKAFEDSNGDMEKMFDVAPKYGVSVPSFLKMRQSVNEMRNSYAQMDKNVLEDSEAHHKDLAGKLQAIIDAPADQQQDLWTKGLQDASASGDLTPEMLQQLPAQFPGVDKATQFMHGLMMQGDLVSQALAEKKAQATEPGEQAKSVVSQLGAIGQILGSSTNQAQWAAGRAALQKRGVSDDLLSLVPTTWSTQAQADAGRLGMSPEQAVSTPALQAKYVDILTRMAQGKPVTADERSFVPAYEKLRTMTTEAQAGMLIAAMRGQFGNAPTVVPGTVTPNATPGGPPTRTAPTKVYPMGDPNLTGQAFVNSIGDKSMQNQVRQIILGQQDFSGPSGFGSRSPYAIQLTNMVQRADPTWTPLRFQLTRQYTLDNKGTIDAMNVALPHVAALEDASKGLNTGDVNLVNRAANALGVEIGQSPVITYETILHRVGPELVKAYTGRQPTDEEINKFEADFDPKHSLAQRSAAIQATVGLLRGKFSSMENQWNQVFSGNPPYSFEDRWLSPQSKQVVQQITGRTPGAGGGGGGTTLMRAPNGQLKQVPNDQVQHYLDKGATKANQQ